MQTDKTEVITSKESVTTKPKINHIYKTCPQQTVDGLFWPQTEVGLTRTVNCGQDKSKRHILFSNNSKNLH